MGGASCSLVGGVWGLGAGELVESGGGRLGKKYNIGLMDY